jgi:class 3 adenylate cyclase
VATAYKLAGAAKPGQIVASEITMSATQGAFLADELPDLGLTGRAARCARSR